ncbi:MAG TPA: hypothetical protein VMG32_10900 [Anaeromyxobacteraceae bacterium]|nr:hypothetical protein [Anaeromyxobacteraceae bacterium]
MAEAKRMVAGFNHNVKHRGRSYHVQTEDFGLDNPQIVTHLFVGGNILASKKLGYADIAEAEDLARVVRELMEEQHKDVLRNLVSGVYEEAEETLGAVAYQPGELTASAEAPEARSTEGAPARATPPPLPLAAAARPGATPVRSMTPLPKEREGAETLVFGEDLFSERSLDEVILSYLAEDAEKKP